MAADKNGNPGTKGNDEKKKLTEVILDSFVLESNLKEILAEKEMSIRELSRKVGFNFEAVRKLYNNELVRLPTDLILRVCLTLDVTLDELFTIKYKGSNDIAKGDDKRDDKRNDKGGQ